MASSITPGKMINTHKIWHTFEFQIIFDDVSKKNKNLLEKYVFSLDVDYF